jgi:hypothetical protein
MPWDNTQVFQTTFVGESDLEGKLKNGYVGNHLAQFYFIELRNKRKVKRITLLNGLLEWKQYCLLYPKEKCAQNSCKKCNCAQCAFGGTLWKEDHVAHIEQKLLLD